MLKRLYVDNYKCMVNFEFVPQATQLILGANGSGKSSIFDVLLFLRHFTTGQDQLQHLVDLSTSTAWEKRTQQAFELEVQGNGGLYKYALYIECDNENNRCRVRLETLCFDGEPLLKFNEGNVEIHNSLGILATYSLSRNQSALVTLSERQDHQLHRWFRDWMASIQLIRINPYDILPQTSQENSQLLWTGANFASWYRHLIQDSPDLIEEIKHAVAEVWNGFKGLRLESAGPNTKILKVMLDTSLNGAGTKYEIAWSQLSDGQKILIVLYTLLHYLKSSKCPLVGIDEPDNFVALQEIQPWLMSLCEAVEDHDSQVLLISHHPEIINYLTPENAVVFSRSDGGPTRVKPFQTTPGSTLTPAEVISRGWDGE